MRSIYFDYNATTPLDPVVRDAMLPLLGEVFGNPSSVHHVGRRARAILDDSRERASTVFRCKPSEVVFTSGGTESANLAIFGTARRLRDRGRHLITSPIEHHAVLNCFEYLQQREGFDVTLLPVDSAGLVDPADLKKAIRPDTLLVSVMAANNETGSIQPVSELGALCRERGVLFHTDAVQWFGKEPFSNVDQFNADMVSICSHKFHGPKGAGALYVRSPLVPDPIVLGGSHENERRAGTESLASIAGFVEALARFVEEPVFSRDKLYPLTCRLEQCANSIPEVTVQGSKGRRLANTIAFTVEGCDSIALLAGLDIEGVCASSGSACSSGSLNPSHVLVAMGVAPPLANSFLRFSIGRGTTLEEVQAVEVILPDVIKRVRAS